MQGFYWLIKGTLAGCPRPGGRRWTAGDLDRLDDDLAWLQRQGIGAVLSLTEEPLADGALTRHGLVELHLPVDDMTAPTPAQIEAALAYIDLHVAQGSAVAVHCLVGQGRTGTILAAYLIRAGHTHAAALQDVRGVCPGAIESAAQIQALADYAQRRDWLI